MHFAHPLQHNGSKASKFAFVAGLHALVAVGVINMMNGRVFSPPSVSEPDVVFTKPTPVEPVTPIDPPTPAQQVLPPPSISVPQTEIDIAQPLVQDPIRTTTETTPTPDPTPISNAKPDPQPVAKPNPNSGAMHRAVLADANSCAKPNYPVQSARNGDSGTVVLALLVGTDGRVTDARIQKSSGYRELDRAAVNALSLCQFKPALNNGVPEAGWGQIAYVWSLE